MCILVKVKQGLSAAVYFRAISRCMTLRRPLHGSSTAASIKVSPLRFHLYVPVSFPQASEAGVGAQADSARQVTSRREPVVIRMVSSLR